MCLLDTLNHHTSTQFGKSRGQTVQERHVRVYQIHTKRSRQTPSRCILVRPQGFHDVARNLLQPRLGDEHPRRLAHILLSRRTDARDHLARQTLKLLLLKGLRASHEDLERRDDEFYRNRVLLRKGNLCHRFKRRAALEHLTPRTGFGIRKFESMGYGKERRPTRDGHRELLLPTKKVSESRIYRLVKSTIGLPIIEEGEQGFELEDRDILQTNYSAVRISAVVGIADLAMSHNPLTELGGVRGQEVLVYSETSRADLLKTP